jgi:hypothetical protein
LNEESNTVPAVAVASALRKAALVQNLVFPGKGRHISGRIDCELTDDPVTHTSA